MRHKKFKNLYPFTQRSFFELLKWKLTSTVPKWQIPDSPPLKYLPQIPAKNETLITLVGHDTLLIQTGSVNLLTDPIWSKRAGPFSFTGPQRQIPPGIDFAKLPPIDLVLVSHNHYDHMDIPTLVRLKKRFDPLFLVPLNNAHYLNEYSIGRVEELGWWDKIKPHKNTHISLVPAHHWSLRNGFDKNEALWGGFVMELNKSKIFFAGDTGYSPHFKDISAKYGAMDISLLPIGAYEPRWFMKDSHMNPEDAVQATMDLKARICIPMHFGSFQLTDETFDAPLNDLKAALKKQGVSEKNFKILKEGQSFVFKDYLR